MGSVPVMVRSNACHVQGLSPRELVKKGEHEQEFGAVGMEGDLEENPGINLRALIELFRLRDERDGEYTVVMSQVEVYCEMVRDLLAPPSRAGQAMDLKSVGDGAYVATCYLLLYCYC